MKIREIIEGINSFAPLGLQEKWDNSGLQVGPVDGECTGVMLSVDITLTVISEAAAKGCNLIVSHHPLLFHGLKRVSPGESAVQDCVYEAIRRGITIYSSHTALDSTRRGISYRMAQMLGAEPLRPLEPAESGETGLGYIAKFKEPINGDAFAELVKQAFGSPIVRTSRCPKKIETLGVCGGSGGEFIPRAIAEGCDAYLTSDVRYHDFVDYGEKILIADIGHFESEECAKQIFYEVISEKFPNFAVYKSNEETNPIKYR